MSSDNADDSRAYGCNVALTVTDDLGCVVIEVETRDSSVSLRVRLTPDEAHAIARYLVKHAESIQP